VTAADPSSICISCALCCDGTIFGNVPVRNDETATLVSAGFNLTSLENVPNCFLQPCQALSGAACTRYNVRPNACRAYECISLRAFKDGEIDESEIRSRIGRVRQALDEIGTVAYPGETLREVAERCASSRDDPQKLAETAPLAVKIGVLRVLVNRWFEQPKPGLANDPMPIGTSRKPGER